MRDITYTDKHASATRTEFESILKKLHVEEGQIEELYEHESIVTQLLNDGLTEDEVVEFIDFIQGSEIYCDNDITLLFEFLHSCDVFKSMDDFAQCLKGKKGSCVFTLLSTGKIVSTS